MNPVDSAAISQRIRDAASAVSGVDLLLLFGSQARGDARPPSDWDFGYLADTDADIPGLLASLVEITGSDQIDLADLSRASGVLRFHAARDGKLVFERTRGAGDAFRLAAAHFWCDMAPVFGPGHADVLARLNR